MGIGGVFFNGRKGSSDDPSDSNRESAPRGAGDSRKGAMGSSSGPSYLGRVDGGLLLGVNGDVAPYKL
jgi:hypothetical protein